uniref:FIT family protein n=1 Tax=Panagrolaimus sp. JU765 TaxID=591449 RepID=A0AC34QH41_9BILA
MSQERKRRDSGSTLVNDVHHVLMETGTQLARKLLFISTDKKAIFYFLFVFLVSLFAAYSPLSDDWYFAKKNNIFNQYGTKVGWFWTLITVGPFMWLTSDDWYFAKKNNIFNQYGTKVGWFWTLITVGPFMWLTSYLHHNSNLKAAQHLVRLVVATGIWYFVTHTFVHIEKTTGRCIGSPHSLRHQCHDSGGKWAPGIDISGHCFLLIYNILILSEESISFKNWPRTARKSISFKNWPRTARSTASRLATVNDVENFKRVTMSVQGLFILLFFFHLFWDFQLLTTCLYYHTLNHKVLGAATAIIAWFLTYRIAFPNFFPGMPIRRPMKVFPNC